MECVIIDWMHHVGVLGQIGALLELAEQIQNGEVPDPEGLVVTCGSFCTFTGILMGKRFRAS